MSHDNVQFVLILLSIFVSILFNNRGLDKVETRVAALQVEMNNRFNEVNTRFNEVNNRFNEVSNRFNNIDARIDRIHQDFGTFHSVQGEHKAKIDVLERRR